MWKRLAKIVLSLASMGIVIFDVYSDAVDLFTLTLYLFSIVMCLFVLRDFNGVVQKSNRENKNIKKDIAIIVPLIILQLLTLWTLSQFPTHFHRDEFIQASASLSLPPFKELNWFAGFPDKGQWIVQFPILFFILQKPFLTVLGPSVESIRISVLPYAIMTLVYLYFLAKEVFMHRSMAATTVLTFTFLAPQLYIASLGQHLMSSAAFSLAAIYYFVLLMRTREKKHAIICGIFVALSYLTNTASYITAPLIALFVIFECMRRRSSAPVKLILPGFIIFFIILIPFVVYASANHNYFVQRVNTVSLLWGQRSDFSQKPLNAINATIFLKQQLVINFKSLYTGEIGGIDGYLFGRQALFNPVTFVLFITGIAFCMYHGFIQKKRNMLYFLVATLAAFLGMSMTVPPGGFHRIYVAFPFIAIIITSSINSVVEFAKKVSCRFGVPVIYAVIIVLFVFTNLGNAVAMVKQPGDNNILDDSVYVASYVQEHFTKGSAIYIAAFPTYHLERELFFRTKNQYKFSTNYFEPTLKLAYKSPIILLYPNEEQIKKLRDVFPNGTVIDTIKGHKLKNHIIFVPEENL